MQWAQGSYILVIAAVLIYIVRCEYRLMRSLRDKKRFQETSILFRVKRVNGESSLMEGSTELIDKAGAGR